MQLIGLPGREVKVKTGKGKAITKADLPALSGPEMKKMVDGHEVVLDAIISRSDPIRPKLKKVWDRYIALTAAWKQRGLYSTVEQHVVAAIREHWTVARASYIRVTSKLTWRRYQYLIHALSKRWIEDKGEHEVLLLPYGTPMCLLPSKNEVWEWEDRVAKIAGLEISEDGKRAIIDVMQALRTRLAQFPKVQLPENTEIVIQFCGELPSSVLRML
eukprot:jgi/Tetstr1/457022/TSEL_043686.t1